MKYFLKLYGRLKFLVHCNIKDLKNIKAHNVCNNSIVAGIGLFADTIKMD